MANVKRSSVLDVLSGKAKGSGKLSPSATILAAHLSRGAPSGKASGEGAIGGDGGGPNLAEGLKKFGTSTLNALSVPGAVVTTSLTNAIRGSRGEDLISWKNLGGTFRGDKFAGGRVLNETLGLGDNRWLGLATDIALDPLWVVGIGALTAPAKLSRGANEVARAARFEKLKEARRVEEAFAELAPQIGKGDPTVVSRMSDLAVRSTMASQGARASGVVPSLRLGMGAKRVDGVRTLRGVRVPLWYKPIMKRDPAKLASGRFNLSPVAATLSRAQDRARGLQNLRMSELDKAIKEIGNVDEAVLARVGQIMLAANDDARGAQDLIAQLRAMGIWDKTHDDVLELFSRTGREQADQLGWITHAEQGKKMEAFLKERFDATTPFLAAAADAANAVDSQMTRAVETIRQTKQARVEKAAAQVELEVARIEQQAADIRTAADMMTANATRAERELESVRAQLAARYNDPKYARTLVKSNRGRRLRGWSPKDEAQARTQQRRTALRNRERALARQAEAQRQAATEMTRQAETAAKLATKSVKKLNTKANRQITKIVDRFAKVERDTIEQFTKRKKALSTQLASLAKDTDNAIASEARVFAQNENLTEFTQGRRMEMQTNKDGTRKLAPLKKKPAVMSVQEIHEKAIALMNRGDYIQHAPNPEMMEEVRDFMNARRAQGIDVSDIEGNKFPGATKAQKKRTAKNPFTLITEDQNIELMIKAGIPADEAQLITDRLAAMFEFSKEAVPFAKKNMPGITWRPDINAYSIVSSRERQQYDMLLKRSFIESFQEAFPLADDYQGMWDDLIKEYNTKRIPGSPAQLLGYAKVKRGDKKVPGDVPRIQLATAWMKAYFTVLNPGHFFMNIFGSFVNDLILGNRRHLATGWKGHVPGGEPWKMGQMDLNSPVMKKVYKIGDQEFTGYQLGTYARLSGLGIGYTQAEIEMVAHIFEGTSRANGVARLMNKLNMDRENADRVWSWINHMKGGDGPLEAAAKVIRTKFDYNAATHFERIWMRNLFLFYTWMKNNLILQGQGVLARPGIYSTMNHIENTRPKDPGEPSWWKEAGGLYTPYGLLTFGNPLADVYKYEASQENFRKNILGAMTPFISSPLQLATNQDFFTGGELSKFADQNVPSPAGYVLNPLGIGQPSRAQADGERSPAIPWYLAKVLKDFSGPYGSTLATLTSRPDNEASPMHALMPRFLGARINPEEPEKWQRSLKARQTRKKADATRKRNYEKP